MTKKVKNVVSNLPIAYRILTCYKGVPVNKPCSRMQLARILTEATLLESQALKKLMEQTEKTRLALDNLCQLLTKATNEIDNNIKSRSSQEIHQE